MKKYIEPEIQACELLEEDFIASSPNNVETNQVNNIVTADDDLVKKIDFSDEKTIW